MSERLDISQVLIRENTAGYPTGSVKMSTKSTNEHKTLLEDEDETTTQCGPKKKVVKRLQPKNKVDEVEWIIVRDDQEDEEVATYCLLYKSPNAFQHTPDDPPRYLTADQFAFTGASGRLRSRPRVDEPNGVSHGTAMWPRLQNLDCILMESLHGPLDRLDQRGVKDATPIADKD